MDTSKLPASLLEATRYFKSEINCHRFLVDIRWPNGMSCPRCGSDKIGKFNEARRLWLCKGCKKQFTAKVGTIYEDSPLSLTQWLPATWLIVNAKNGISSCELARSLDVTQKTAWFMLHRIRYAMQNGSIEKMSGRVEADETYIGGKARFMHRPERVKRGNAIDSKEAVQGILQRGEGKKHSRVMLRHVKNIRKEALQDNVRAWVLDGSEVFTDALLSYDGLAEWYGHKVINHAESYAQGHVHTNGLENFWSLLKRGLKGTYVSVEPFHLFRYLDEQAFRFNERKDNDQGRFITAMRGIAGKGLRYAKLIGKQASKEIPPSGTWQTA